MESEEGQAEAQDDRKGEEAVVNEETTVEGLPNEAERKISGLLPETGVGQGEAKDSEASEGEAKDSEASEGEAKDSEASEGKVEDLLEASQGETEEEVEKEHEAPATGELMEPDQDTFEPLAELDRGVAEDALKGDVALDMSGEEAEEIIEPDLGKAEELETVVLEAIQHQSNREKEEAEESSEPNQEEISVSGSPDEGEAEGKTGKGMDQQETEEFIHEEEALVGEGEMVLEMGGHGTEELAGPDHGKEEDLVEEDRVDSGERVEKGDEQQKLMGLQEGEAEATVRDDEAVEEAEKMPESVELGESDKEVGESTEDKGKMDELSGLGQGEILEVTGKEEDVVPAMDYKETEKVSGVNERELEEVTAEEDAILARGQEELVGLGQGEIEVLSGEEEPVLDKREAEMTVGPGEEGLGEEIEREDRVSGVDQREAESMIVEGDVVSAEGWGEVEDSVKSSRGEAEEVAPSMDQVKAEALQEDLRESELVIAEGEAGASEEKAEHLVVASQEEVEGETEKESMPSTLDQGSPGIDERQVEEVTTEKDVESVEDQKQVEDLAGISQGEIGDMVATVEEGEAEKVLGEDKREAEVSISKGDAAFIEGEGLVVTSQEETEEVTVKEDMIKVAIDVAEQVIGAAQRETEEMTAMGQEEGREEAVGAPERIAGTQEETGGLEEVLVQSQEMGAEEEVKLGTSQEKVGDLAEPEQRETKEHVGLDQEEARQLGSTEMVTREESREKKEALVGDQSDTKVLVEPFQGPVVEVTSVGEIVLAEQHQGTLGRKVSSQEKTLIWSPELEEQLGGPTQEMAGVPSREVILSQRARPIEEDTRVTWLASDTNLARGRVESSLKVAELKKSGSSVLSSHFSQRTAIGSQEERRKLKGKIISGLAGLRQGPILVPHQGATRSCGFRRGVLEHRAPGLIVTSLTAMAQQKGMVKEASTQLGKGELDQRETRSAELRSRAIRVKVGEPVVMMGYRIGREGMSCFSEADNRIEGFQHVPMMEEAGKEPDQTPAELPRQEEKVKELETLAKDVDDRARQHPEGMYLPWLGRPLTQDYATIRPGSGWTAGLGSGHGLALGPLRAGIKERINMMVTGQGAVKSGGPSPEPPVSGMGRRVFGLTSQSGNVHWVKDVLGSKQTVSRLSVTVCGSKASSPDSMAGRRSPGVLTGKQELKDWRDGVMGIAIKRYNAMRRAMWGEGPAGLHVKGVKVAEISNGIPLSSVKTSSILGQVEQRALRLAQHVEGEAVSGLEVEGQGLADRLKQDMESAGSGQGGRITR
ncbi:uncharacterized protein LOC132593046 [Zootoca vivipara]|uniref:uncharacterized protein LOC132593046 n=1 Tax=Zootoca vivipara TaxID=8524 RepID=UPI00293B8CDA|nr:uncharacterized protein LOC132593046 [Zootoca vivipara]